MSMNMQQVKELEIDEGDVRTIHDENGKLLWGRLAYNTTYGGDTDQDGTPTPDVPIDVDMVTGSQTIKVHGKNLFDINSLAQGSVTVSDGIASGTAGQFYTEFSSGITLLSTSPIMSITVTGYRDGESSTGNGLLFRAIYTDETTENIVIFPNSTISPTTLTGSTDSSKTLDKIAIVYGSGSSNMWHLTQIQIEAGSTPSSYEVYQSSDYTLNLGSTKLYKIGSYQDYIYKSGSEWYIQNNIAKVVFTGASDETWTGGSSNIYFFHVVEGAYQPENRSTKAAILSDYYPVFTYNQVASTTIDYGVALDSNNAGRFAIRNKDCANATDFKTWLASNNTTVYYPLATPTDTQITDSTLISQLEAIHEWLTRYGYNATVTGNLPLIINQTNLS